MHLPIVILYGEDRFIDFGILGTLEFLMDTTRMKILAIPYSKWKRMGFSKGTLHYLKKNANSDRPFKVYGKVREKLEVWY